MTMKTWQPKPMESSKSSSKWKFIVIQSYLKKQGKHQIDNLTLHLKTGKRRKENPQISRRKEIIKIQGEMNEKEMKQSKG